MSLALEIVCGKFGMELTDNPVTRVVAQKIIEHASREVSGFWNSGHEARVARTSVDPGRH
jgi:hypothetical protein